MLVGFSGAAQSEAGDILLADPAAMLTTATRVDFIGRNSLTIEELGSERYLRSIPTGSASALYHKVGDQSAHVERVRWTWRVDELPGSADLRSLEREDVAATVMFVFGDPTLLNRDVPTLAYTWTGTPARNGSIIISRRYGSLAYLKLRGREHVGMLQSEDRDLAADFRAVFGREPEPLRYVAVFNDNDQTRDPVSALFGPIFTTSWGRPLETQKIR